MAAHLRNTRAARLLALVLGAALLAGACGSDDEGSGSTATTAAPTPLEGTAWELTTGGGLAADLTPAGVTATFEGGTVSGNGGCNEYNAAYTLSGQDLTIGPNIAATRMMCEEPKMAVETAYFTLLAQVGAFSITGTTLTLSSADLQPLLLFEAQA